MLEDFTKRQDKKRKSLFKKEMVQTFFFFFVSIVFSFLETSTRNLAIHQHVSEHFAMYIYLESLLHFSHEMLPETTK